MAKNTTERVLVLHRRILTILRGAVTWERLALASDPLPVCEGARLVGMLTAHASTGRTVAAGHDPQTTEGRAVMTPEVVDGCAAQEVQNAVRLMPQDQMRRCLVPHRCQ